MNISQLSSQEGKATSRASWRQVTQATVEGWMEGGVGVGKEPHEGGNEGEEAGEEEPIVRRAGRGVQEQV